MAESLWAVGCSGVQRRNWYACMGFLYTVISMLPSSLWWMFMSRNATVQLISSSSGVSEEDRHSWAEELYLETLQPNQLFLDSCPAEQLTALKLQPELSAGKMTSLFCYSCLTKRNSNYQAIYLQNEDRMNIIYLQWLQPEMCRLLESSYKM